jgi:hypothetical protein
MKSFLSGLGSLFGKSRPESGESPEESSSFQAQNVLERALMGAAVDPAARPAFEQLVLKSELYVATPEAPPAARERVLERDEMVNFFTVPGPDGGQLPALFTSEARIAEVFGAGIGFLRINGATLLEMVAGDGAFLNPGLDYGVHWSAGDLAAMLGHPVRRVLDQDTKVLLGSPASPPEALIRDLAALFREDGRIERAWLALAHWPSGGPAWYLDVRTNLGPDEVNSLLADLLNRSDLGGLSLDMIVNQPGGGDGTGILIPGR